MLDSLLRRRLAGPLAPVAAWAAARKIKSWTLTVSAFLCVAVAMLDIGHRTYLAALALLVVAGAFDLLDGPLGGLGTFEDRDLGAGLAQAPADAQSGNSGADDDDLHGVCATMAATRLPAATKHRIPTA